MNRNKLPFLSIKLTIFIFTLLIYGAILGCTSWTNPTPDYVEPTVISWDSGLQNSGILASTDDESGFIVTKHLIDRYNAMIKLKCTYIDAKTKDLKTVILGELFIPKLKKNAGVTASVIDGDTVYIIDNQHMSYFLYMNAIRKVSIY